MICSSCSPTRPSCGYVCYALLVFGFAAGLANSATVTSPDGELRIEAAVADGKPTYSATWRGEALIEESDLGAEYVEVESAGWQLRGDSTSTVDETWHPVVGKRAEVRNHCNELVLELAKPNQPAVRLDVVLRAYNDGFAIRCRVPIQSKAVLHSLDEVTKFRFVGDPQLWSYRRERAPLGPTQLSKAKGKLASPLLVDLGSGHFAAVHEAELRNSAWLELEISSGALSVANKTRSATSGDQTPWRVVMVGDSLGELVDSDLLANLNPKADPKTFAWVKPGVALWDWRSWGYHAPDGFEFGLNLESWKRFIDFAAEHEIPYVLLDANWYGPEMEKASNPFTGGLAADVQKAIAYSKQRNVGLLLYLNDVAGRNYDIEKILETWSSWGAAGIKYGFMEARTPQEKVEWTRRIVELCAKNHLLVNFHDGPIPPTGDEATLPNWATREFCHAQSDAKRAFTPTTFLMQMAVNQLAGPIDMNNGMFDLYRSVAERPRVFVEVPATITAEAARTLIVYSGLTVIPDATAVYRRHPDLFQFISAQKMPWTQSRTLDFRLGESIVVMRQSADGYLVAAATNEEPRTLQIELDFLPEGQQFTAIVCEDAPEAHYTTNREAYVTRTIDVNTTTAVEAKLAPGGGYCLLITPKN